MSRSQQTTKLEYVINQKGDKKGVILSLKQYEAILEQIEDLEDANDLLRAEREATSFIPYDEFRKVWLKG